MRSEKAQGKKSRTSKLLIKGIQYPIILSILIAPIMLGGNRDWSYITLTSLLMVPTALWFIQPQRLKHSQSHTTQLLGMMLIFTLIQLVPIPASLLESISPNTFEILATSIGDDFSSAPITLDVPHTQHEAIKLIGYLLLALSVSYYHPLKQRHKRLPSLVSVIAVSGTIVATIGGVHALMGWTSTFNSFPHAQNLFSSTFVNNNHLAAFLGLTSFCSMSSFLRAQIHSTKVLWALNTTVIVCTLFLTLSRAGSIIFAIVLSTLLMIFFIHQKEGEKSTDLIGPVFLLGFLLILTISAVLMVYQDPILAEYRTIGNSSLRSKMNIWPTTLSMVEMFPMLGIGKGAFVSVYPIYATSYGQATYTSVENEYLSALVEWGPIAGTLIILMAVRVTYLLVKMNKSNQDKWPLLAAIGFIGLHNFIDFNLSTMGIGIPLVAILTVLEPNLQKTPRPRLQGAVILTMMVLAPVLAISSLGNGLNDDTDKITTMMANKAADTNLKLETIEQAINRHPADYYLQLLKATTQMQTNPPHKDLLRTVNTALFLAPNYSMTHLQAARALWQLNFRSQAYLEYRKAILVNPVNFPNIAAEVFSKNKNYRDMLQLAGPNMDTQLMVAQWFKEQGQLKMALQVLNDQLEDNFRIWRMRCEIQKDVGDYPAALSSAKKLRELYPFSHYGYYWASLVFTQLGQWENSVEVLDQGLKNIPRNQAMRFQKAYALIKLGRNSGAREELQRLEYNVKSAEDRANLLQLRAELSLSRNQRSQAIKYLVKAHQLDPKQLNYLDKAVTLYLKAKNSQAALKLVDTYLEKNRSDSNLLMLKEKIMNSEAFLSSKVNP